MQYTEYTELAKAKPAPIAHLTAKSRRVFLCLLCIYLMTVAPVMHAQVGRMDALSAGHPTFDRPCLSRWDRIGSRRESGDPTTEGRKLDPTSD